jgi:hypothetical protein
MAELLVKAKAHWMDSFPQATIDAMTPAERRGFESRSRIGDIIVVRPDGWVWGSEECLPNFVVVKVPGVSVEDVKHYEDVLQQDEVVTRTLSIDKTEWDDENKKANFVERNRFVDVPTVTETKEVERVVSVPLDKLEEVSAQFKYAPKQADGVKLGMANISGVVDVHTVEGSAINTYLLKHRKHQIDPKIIDDAVNSVVELKDLQEVTDKLTVKTNTPIVERAWKQTIVEEIG